MLRACLRLVPFAIAVACVVPGCRHAVRSSPPPDVAPVEDAPTLRTTPTPPGRQGDVPGPPVVKP